MAQPLSFIPLLDPSEDSLASESFHSQKFVSEFSAPISSIVGPGKAASLHTQSSFRVAANSDAYPTRHSGLPRFRKAQVLRTNKLYL